MPSYLHELLDFRQLETALTIARGMHCFGVHSQISAPSQLH
jgi:hypothetical protein